MISTRMRTPLWPMRMSQRSVSCSNAPPRRPRFHGILDSRILPKRERGTEILCRKTQALQDPSIGNPTRIICYVGSLASSTDPLAGMRGKTQFHEAEGAGELASRKRNQADCRLHQYSSLRRTVHDWKNPCALVLQYLRKEYNQIEQAMCCASGTPT